LFVVAGSFATIRRRRLASPTSIVEIEATHPLVNAAPVRVGWRGSPDDTGGHGPSTPVSHRQAA
jgi:hypothetical protein